MPGKLRRHTYDLVEETYDSKVPVHNEAAFEHGIRFQVKVCSIHQFIGNYLVLSGVLFRRSNEILHHMIR